MEIKMTKSKRHPFLQMYVRDENIIENSCFIAFLPEEFKKM